jgi:hypothetical protein
MFNPPNQGRTIDAPPDSAFDQADEGAAGAVPHRGSLRMHTSRWPFSRPLRSANGFGRPVAAARMVVHVLAALLVVASGFMVAAPPATVLAGSSAYDHDSQVMSVNHPDWMGLLPDSTPLGRISIPGTHDSMALHGGDGFQAQSLCGTSATPGNTSACDITAQLNAGIRYLDIRLKCEGLDPSIAGSFGVYHGAGSAGDQHANFKTDVLDKLQQFLTGHPTETVIMNVQDEGDDLFDSCAFNPDTNTYANAFEYEFAKEVGNYPGLLWKPPCPVYCVQQGGTTTAWAEVVDDVSTTTIPLGKVRGHVVLEQGFAAKDQFKWGIPWNGWQPPAGTSGTGFDPWDIQNNWDVCELPGPGCLEDFNTKVADVRAEALKASTGDTNYHLYKDYLSGSTHALPYRVACGQPCGTFEAGVNPSILDWLQTSSLEQLPHTGIMLMDFPGVDLIAAIIGRNQLAQAITFPPIPPHTYGDPAFEIMAVGGPSLAPVNLFVVGGSSDVCKLLDIHPTGGAGESATVDVLGVGTCDIGASQEGNGVFAPAPFTSAVFEVLPAALTVTSAGTSMTYGDVVPAIAPSYSGFANNDTASSLTTQATCTVAANNGSAGAYATACSGASSPNYTFIYVPGTFRINRAPLTATASDRSMVYGSSVPAFDATLSSFVNGDTSSVVSGVKCGALDSTSRPVSGATPVGQYQITCSGGTTANYILSYKPGTLTISQANTSLTLASAPASLVFGQPVSLTASVAATSPGSGNPSGSVNFKDSGVDITGCNAQAVSASTETAICTTTALGVGSHSLTASYTGDHNFVGSSTTSATTQLVGKAASSITLAPTIPSTQGQTATITAEVAASAPGAGTPTGTVTFSDSGRSLGSGLLTVVAGKAQATFSTSSLATGAHSITASYSGDGNFQTSTTSTAATQYVNTNLSSYPKLANGAYDLSNANLSGAYFVGTSLVGASLNGSNLTGAILSGANLTGADLSNTNFKGGNFTGSNLSGANLANSNLSAATGLKTATLAGVVWNKTECPDGTNSSQDGGTCAGHL